MKKELQKYELPKGWINVSLRDIIILEYGKSLPSQERKKGAYSVWGSNGVVDFHNEFLIEGPAIIIGRKGSVGAVHFSTDKLWPIDTTYYVRPLKSLNLKFVYYLLKGLNLKNFDKSTTIPGLNRENIYEAIVSLPPFNEQQRIVAKIEELFSELDDAELTLTKSQKQLEIYRHSILKNAFNGDLTSNWRKNNNYKNELITKVKEKRVSIFNEGIAIWEKDVIEWKKNKKKNQPPAKPKALELVTPLNTQEKQALPKIPAKWTWGKTLEITDIVMGQSPAGTSYNTKGIGTPLINGPVEFGPTPFSHTILSKWTTAPTKLCEAGDLIICVRGSTTGRQNIAGFKACLGRGVAAIRAISSSQKYIYHYFNYSRRKIFEMGTGTTFPSISLDQLASFPIPVCSNEEQDQIVQEIEYNFTIVDNMEKTIQNEIKKVEIFRQNIIKKAFEGSLVDHDLADEPADQLLLSIKSEKEQYLIEQKEAAKTIPKKTKPMETNKSIIEILKNIGEPIEAKELWLNSKYKNDIDAFYSALKVHLENDEIIEVSRKGKESLITLKKSK